MEDEPAYLGFEDTPLPLAADSAEYAATESKFHVGKPGEHYLNQLSKQAYGSQKKCKADPIINGAVASRPEKVDEAVKMRAFTTVNVRDIMDISTVDSTFTVKLRLYMLWGCDLGEYDPALSRFTERAREHGLYYSLAENEVYEFLSKVPHPLCKTVFFNSVDVIETDSFPGIRV
jgi:hypothetical protein